MGLNLDRGGRDDTRQRRALQRLVTDPAGAISAGSVALSANGGLVYTAGELGIKLDDPGSGLTLGPGGLSVTAIPTIPGKMVELDFGASNASDATFTIADADILVDDQVFAQQINVAATGRDLDENEFSAFTITATVTGAGSVDLFIQSVGGRVSGKFVFVYVIVGT